MTQVLLLGDSLVADHDWQSRMPSYKVVNLAIPGVTTSELLTALPDIKHRAKYADVIMLMVGTNDMLTGNFEFIDTLKKVFVQLSQDFVTAEVVVISLFPMKLAHMSDTTIDNLNGHIEQFTVQTGCCFLDIHSRFADSQQTIFQEDGVHLTKEAYEIWTRALLEHIAFLVEND